jgi:hypothetical protein
VKWSVEKVDPQTIVLWSAGEIPETAPVSLRVEWGECDVAAIDVTALRTPGRGRVDRRADGETG